MNTSETPLRQRLEQIGARVRMGEIDAEIAELRAAFPDLDGATQEGHVVKIVIAEPAKRRGDRTMSAAMRLAVSKRMKKYWRDRRRTEAAQG